MSDSSMDFSQQHENQSSLSEVNEVPQARDPVQTVATGLGTVSGGLAGALIGRLVAGRLGAAVGAVVGGVAGANVGREAAIGVDATINEVVNEVKQTVEDIKPAVIDTVDAVKQNIEAAQTSVIVAIDSVRETMDEARPAVTETIHAVTETIDEARPSVVETVDDMRETIEETRPAVKEAVQKTSESVQSSAASVAGSVQGAAQSVKGAAQDAQPKMTQAREDVSESVQSSASNVADSVQRATQDTASSNRDIDTTSDMGQAMMLDQPYGQSGILEDIDPIRTERTLTNIGSGSTLAPDQTGIESIDQKRQGTAAGFRAVSDSNDSMAIQDEFERGIFLSEQGDLDGAKTAFAEVIRVMPDAPEAYFNMGMVLFQQGRETESRGYIRQARDLATTRGDLDAAVNLDIILKQMESNSLQGL